MQSLEDRRVLALLGIAPDYPILFSTSTGSLNYEAASDTFTAEATPVSFQPSFFGFASSITGPASFDLEFKVDSNGDFAGGLPGDDFTLTGAIDIDFDGTADVSGVLLSGNVTQFGFSDGAPSTSDSYDMRLTVTGGELATAGVLSTGGVRPAYFGGFDIGIAINSEFSDFTNDFTIDFSGDTKATLGPIEPDDNEPVPVNLGDRVWYDDNVNGIQDNGELGVEGVTVNLYVDTNGNGIAEPNGADGPSIATDVTDANGFYLFEGLFPGEYFVEFETGTLPAGYQLTGQNAGTDDAVDSDADQTTGLTEIISLGLVDDLTWDAGINLVVNPDIQIVKYVDKIVETSECVTIDFDTLHQGDTVGTQYSGVTVSAHSNSRPTAGNAAMVFNSASPTGGDVDLGTPNMMYGGLGQGGGGASNDTALGNILIISEDGDASDPDDDAHGGYFTFEFDSPVTINYLDLLDIDSNESGGSVVTLTTSSGSQTIAIPTAGNNSYQRLGVDVADVTSMTVNFVSSGAITELKYTMVESEKQWFDANTVAESVGFEIGETVEFSYHVTNPGDVELVPVVVTDDNATPGNTSDDFNPTPVETTPGINDGDTDLDGRLDPGEEWLYTYQIVATVAGQFTNIGDVVGTPVNPNGDVIGEDVTDDDPANYHVNGTPDIDIEKLTNGVQADLASEAVEIAPGETVTWTYIVTNTGTAPLLAADVIVVDDNGTPNNLADDFTPDFVGPDAGSDGVLSPGEVWNYTKSSTAQTLTSSGATSTLHFSGNSSLDGTDGNLRTFTVDGVTVNTSAFSRDANGNWSDAYLGLYSSGLGVTDTGEGGGGNGTHRVDNSVRDNYVLFEFSSDVVVDQAFLDSVVNDSDLSIWIGSVPGAFGNHQSLSDSFLNSLTLNEVNDTTSSSARWANFNGGEVSGNVLVLAASVADATPEDNFKIRKVKFQQLTTGIYGNVVTVTADGAFDSDPSHYKNPAPEPPGIPGIDIEKSTNLVDADTPAEAVEIAAGAPLTWTYTVTNTGETDFAFADVIVVDDNGTPGDSSDDFSPTFDGGDTNNDGILSPGEIWTYETTTTAESLTVSGATNTVYFNGNSALDGPDGNVRSFSAGGVSVDARAFSRSDSGNWSKSYLGSYSSGLGVTDSSEGNGGSGTHRVDNTGRDNYVVFEFSENVIVDQAYLDSVVNDSDLSIWIGTVPGGIGNQTLSDAFLSGLTLNEVSNTTSSSSRWANFNGGEVSGNILVLAASVVDATPEDNFKISKVKFQQLADGIYGNVGSVQAGEVSDSDPSHYKNPVAAPSGKIGDVVWNDLDRDGKQDSNESGVSGVTVNLYDDNGSVISTTMTGPGGVYEFTGLEAGDYQVGFELPNDYVFTQQRHDISDSVDSDADRTTGKSHVITLEDHEVDLTIDAGIYEAAVDVMFEAEHYEWLDSPWKVKCSSDASGGKYLMAPNGTGSHYNAPPSGKKVMYRFDTEVSGNFELSALVKATNGANNSVWLRVDGGDWVEWHTPVTGYDFQWHAATNGWNNDPVTFSLGAGSHTLELKVREDGTKFDKFMVSKLSTNTVVIDATSMTSMSGDWAVDVDDDGNEFLVAANGTGNFYNAPPAGDELTYNFSLNEGGVFEMYALVSAANGGDNSLWIQIDGGDWIQWHLTVTGDSFEWQSVTDGFDHNEVSFDLAAGNHTLTIKVREDGTKLDKIVITDDQFIDLSDY